MEKLRLGIDVQTLFTFEKNRGIGRYTCNLIRALSKMTSDDFRIVLFGFSQTPPDEMLPLLGKNLEYRPFASPKEPELHLNYDVFGPILWDSCAGDIDWFLVTSPLILNILIPESAPCKIAAVIYDLIPLLFQGEVKKTDVGKLRQQIYPPHLWERYLKRLEIIKNYDLFFSISQSTTDASADELEIPLDKIETLYCGIAKNFTQQKNPAAFESLKSKLRLPKRYILSVSGFNFRKNLEGGIRIYSKLPRDVKNHVSYVIHCEMRPEEKAIVENWISYHGVKGKVILSGELASPDELAELYRNAEVFFFPSYYEGLGLPALEAMACGTPVAISDSSGLAEIARDCAVAVDPHNEQGFASAIQSLLGDKKRLEQMRASGLKKTAQYSWEGAADAVVRRLAEGLVGHHSDKIDKSRIKPVKGSGGGDGLKNIAYFSPLNPMHSGISDYSESLLHELRKYFNIDLFVEDYIPQSPDITQNHEFYSYRLFNHLAAEKKYDAYIYNMGNNSLHKIIYKMIKTHPGIVVLHEYSLCGFFRDGLHKHFTFADLWGHLSAEPERDIEAIPSNINEYLDSLSPMKYPFLKEIVQNAKKIIVHSKWLKEKIITWRNESEAKGRIAPALREGWGEIDVINMGADMPPAWISKESAALIRKKMLIAEDAFVIGVVGTINRFKRIGVILEAFDIFRRQRPNSVIVISGTCADIGCYIEIRKIIEARRFGNSVMMLGYMEMDNLIRLISASDVCVNLRYPTLGEMSGIVPRILGLGKPLVVTDTDSFRELPDTCCFKLPVGQGETQELSAIFRLLAENSDIRARMGEFAAEYVKSCSWAQTAERYKGSIIPLLSPNSKKA